MATFSTWDYIILILMLLISAGIGLYYRFTGGKQKTTQVLQNSYRIKSYSSMHLYGV